MRRKSEFHQAKSRSLWKLVTDLEVNDLQSATRQLTGALLDRWFHIRHVLPKTLAIRLPCLKDARALQAGHRSAKTCCWCDLV